MIGKHILKIIVRVLDMKIYPIFFILLSACATTSAPKGPISIANDLFFNVRQGDIVSDCRNASISYAAIAEIVCYDAYTNGESHRQTFQEIETIFRNLGWETPGPNIVKNSRRRAPSNVSDEDFFVLKLAGIDNCNWTTLIVFVDKIIIDKNNRQRVKISFNKFYEHCDVLI